MFNRRKISLALGMLTAVVLTAGALITSTARTGPEAESVAGQTPQTVTLRAVENTRAAAD